MYSETGTGHSTDGLELSDYYGTHCFSNSVMRERLPLSIYQEIQRVQAGKKELTLEVAEVVATAMREWAMEQGATHYTHWFHPLSGLTAEKHESFISTLSDGGVIMEFSGKELVKGESDASSLASGGLRATFEARGYTAWDVTSPAFLKTNPSGLTLCIPTAYVSYNGDALDKKVPLLRSMDALSKVATRILRLLGEHEMDRVYPCIGPEQEYFLVNAELFKKRPDLILTGRTVMGSMPAKGQELQDHYYGAIEEKVAAFMTELNAELWSMGVAAKTQHNEVAPNQFEIACIYSQANIAADANQLVMETIHKVANRHGMQALLHEKPFDGINGSGKHINWSLSTNTGLNLLDPAKALMENDQVESSRAMARFILFMAAVIQAVDTRAGLLRASASTAGNDRRLGGHEAPPSIISVFLGDPLTKLFDSLSNGWKRPNFTTGLIELGARSLPKLSQDFSDRNRTSPFAYTGNKFEFRMVASSQSAATPTTMLNAAVAEALTDFADKLEGAVAQGRPALEAAVEIAAASWKEHKKVVFNGNGYSSEWVKEASARGLPMWRSTVEAIPELIEPSNVAMLEKLGILSADESESRCTIYLERYSKQVNIEAGVELEMARRSVFPAASESASAFAAQATALAAIGAPNAAQEQRASRIAAACGSLVDESDKLASALSDAQRLDDPLAKAKAYRNSVIPAMDALRAVCDKLEELSPESAWPFPSYEDLLYSL
ncbi:MAG TPA: glutamine synthetase III [Spirochaetales bacterium]|nr:glutamine synthetase III [Spirochaetales bacterium]HPS15488.1 glutamine synthetase III [Spirochaetales bacterium]